MRILNDGRMLRKEEEVIKCRFYSFMHRFFWSFVLYINSENNFLHNEWPLGKRE